MSYISGIDPTRVTATPEFTPGTIGMNQTSTGAKKFKYISYSEEAAAVDGVAGEVAYYVAETGYAAHDVTSDLTASDEVGAGVLGAIMSDGEFGWIQISGLATLTIALSDTGDGNPLTPTGSADGSLDVSAAVTDHVCAVSGDGSAGIILCQFPE